MTTFEKLNYERMINIMINEEKFTIINSKYLAEALAYLNFRYYKYQDEDKTVYSFKKTDELLNAIASLRSLKKNFEIQ